MRAGKRTRPASGRPAGRGAAPPAAAPERVQKLLAQLGLASRREAEVWIRAGRITINGTVATLGARAGPRDELRLDGRPIRQRAAPRAATAFLCHRSPGENLRPPAHAGAEASSADNPALVERLPRRAGRRFIPISPMPRIDGGLEVVTADGELASRLQRAVHNLTSEFSVRVRGELSEEQIGHILQGTLDSGQTLAVERCEAAGGEGANRWYALAAHGASGKAVRQLFERQGALVSRVLRTRLGPLALERSLSRGHFRALTSEELRALMQAPAVESGEIAQPAGR